MFLYCAESNSYANAQGYTYPISISGYLKSSVIDYAPATTLILDLQNAVIDQDCKYDNDRLKVIVFRFIARYQ